MSFVLRYRLPLLVIFFAGLGLAVAAIVKLGELRWYYIIGTPLIAGVIGLISYFLTDTEWNKILRSRSVLLSLILSGLFFCFLVIHLIVYINGTFRYKDVNNVYRTYIKGYAYSPIALKYKTAHPSLGSDADLLFDGFGGIEGKHDVWSSASIRTTTIHMVMSYGGAILFLSALVSWILGAAYEKRFLDPQKAIQAILAKKDESNYEKYLLTHTAKREQEKFKSIKAHIFLSYSSAQHQLAEKVYYSLTNSGHMVFFDRNHLPPGLEYNNAIYSAIQHSDIFLFMISPESVTDGRYTLSELKLAREKWPAPNGVILPVMCIPTPFDKIPVYAQSVTILIPGGNLEAEVTAEVEKLYRARKHHHQ